MKRLMLYLPLVLLVIVVALWLRHGRAENASLRLGVAKLQAEFVQPKSADEDAAMTAEDEARRLTMTNAALQAELQRLEQATTDTQKELVALQKQLPPSLDSEVTESFGRITDMGAELGQFCRIMVSDGDEVQRELKRRGLEGDELSDTTVKAIMKLTTWAPEMSAFEDTPAEIASLQSNALREAFALNATQTQQAESIIRAHFATMKAAKLTHSSHDDPGWRERRNASLTQLLWKLRPLIPANTKLAANLSMIVNIGGGLETKTIPRGADGTPGQVVQSFPNWPAVPWLPSAKNP